MTPIKCFVITPSATGIRSLRRYVRNETICPAHPTREYHNASVDIGRFPIEKTERGFVAATSVDLYKGEERWPKACDCGYQFTDADEFQVNNEEIYLDENGKEFTLRNPVPGMMYDSFWMPDSMKAADGRCLTVVCPDGSPWQVDARANNCTDPTDWAHRCWVRHGEWPNVTVDKDGLTCKAGAGSIQTAKWHGFLRGGFLVE